MLVSGTSSGLGAFLAKELNSKKFHRKYFQAEFDNQNFSYESIIHAAYAMPLENESEVDYIEKHLKLAIRLLNIPHHRFVFMSTIDTYAPRDKLTLYAKSKLEVESLIKSKTSNYLILKPGTLLGRGMRINQIIKVATITNPHLSLSRDSTFSLTFYEDILKIIQLPILGTHPVLAKRIITLGEVAEYFNNKPNWGQYRYETHSNFLNNESEFTNLNFKKIDPILRLAEFIKKEKLK